MSITGSLPSDSLESSEKDLALIPNECNGCTRGGVNCAIKINAQIKSTQDLYWFGLPDLRPVSTTQAEFHYPQVLQRVHLKPLQLQVLDGITCNLTTSFAQAHL